MGLQKDAQLGLFCRKTIILRLQTAIMQTTLLDMSRGENQTCS